MSPPFFVVRADHVHNRRHVIARAPLSIGPILEPRVDFPGVVEDGQNAEALTLGGGQFFSIQQTSHPRAETGLAEEHFQRRRHVGRVCHERVPFIGAVVLCPECVHDGRREGRKRSVASARPEDTEPL